MERVRESIKQVGQNTWLIGDLILHSSSGRSDASSWYDPTDTIRYTLTKAPNLRLQPFHYLRMIQKLSSYTKLEIA